ncbi:MAG: hypothetical protein AAGG75_16460 [Bacteroidota bacterium]
MENISLQYPSWFIILCLALGLGYALLLYYRDKTFREQSPRLNMALGFIRFLTVSLLSLLLLSPLIKSLVTEVKKPVVVLAQDQSESVVADLDTVALDGYKQSVRQLSEALSENYELKEYAFGNEVREGIDFSFQDKVSNISKVLKSIYDLYSNQNLGAVILATDGIYNEGSNPVYASTKLAAPIYTVALGDTTPKRDLVLKRVFHNKIAYLDDKFSIQIDIAAQNCQGAKTTLTVTKVGGGSAPLKSIPLTIDRNDYFNTQEIILDADRSGVQRYRIRLSQVTEEVTTINNTKDIFVDVLDARQKILLLANSAHPDITAIKQSISKNKNYEVTTAYISQQNLNPAAFDFVVLHQLPSKTNDASGVLRQLYENKIPRLYILGTQSAYSTFSKVQPLIDIRADGRNTNDVQATLADNFSLFNLREDMATELPKFAPLLAPFGEFTENANTEILLYQRIGKIDTKYPLLLFGEQNDIKMGVLCAEGIWKWRLFDFLQKGNHDLFDELLGKSIQYLSLKEDKRKFRISLAKNIFNDNEPIIMDAELYNDSYELINDPDVSLTITNDEGKDFNYTFNKTTQGYTLNAGFFPAGNYTFRGQVMNSGKQLTYNGQFSVQPIQLEIYETTADHRLLTLISEKYGGQMIAPAGLGQLASLLQNKETVKPIVYQTSKTRPVINIKWIFFVLLGLLTLEWFLRRYFGAY